MKIDKYFHLWADKSTVHFDEVEHFKGKWMPSLTSHYYCSNCHCFPHIDYEASTLGMNYCPHCGADMRGEE